MSNACRMPRRSVRSHTDILEDAREAFQKRLLAGLFDRFDMLLTPAAAALPWPAEQSHPPTIAGQPVGPRGHAVFTGFANVAGCPAIALPCSPSRAGLPIGLQLVARPGADEALVALAKSYEAARPWRERRPLPEPACSTAAVS